MADEIEKTSPLSFNIKSPIDFAKVNPVGVGEHPHITSTYERMLKSQEELASQLEKRYEQPNLWNIAAAFAKPTLGGFTASLGNAAQELGKNVEAQRAIAPTIARMRAEVAAGQLPLSQRVAQKEAHDAWKAKGMPVNEVQDIIKLDETSPLAKALKDQYGAASTEAGTRSTNVGTSITGQKAVLDNPAIIVNDPIFKGTVAEAKPDQLANYEKMLDAARPQGVSEEEWKAMGVTARSAAVATQAAKKQEQSMTENQKFLTRAQTADNLIGELEPLRELAMDKNVAPVFSAFRDGDLISMYRAYLDKNPGNQGAAVEGMVNAAMDRMKNKDPETRAKVDKLVKGVARLELNLRGSNLNPTDAVTVLNSSQSPSLANSRDGFVGILDQMALQADRDIALYNYRVNAKLGENEYFRDSALRQQYRDRAVELAKTNSASSKPSWYSASSGAGMGKSAAEKTRANQPAATTPAAPASGASSDARSSAEVIAAIKAAKAAQAAQAGQ